MCDGLRSLIKPSHKEYDCTVYCVQYVYDDYCVHVLVL
eukprot:COSAG01_NODE_26742_length_704_cov_2.178512_2_plen_37_part_01